MRMKGVRILLFCIVCAAVRAHTKYLREKEESDVNRKNKGKRNMMNTSRKVGISLYSLSSMFTLFSKSIETIDPAAAHDDTSTDDVFQAEAVSAGKLEKDEQDDYYVATAKADSTVTEITQDTRRLMHHFSVFKAYDKTQNGVRPPQYAKVSRRHAIEEYLSPMQKMMKKKRESTSIGRDEVFDGSWSGFEKIKH